MSVVLRVISVLSIPVTLLLFFMMARMAGKELPAKKRIYLMGMIMPALMLLVNGIFLSAGFNILCGGVSILFFLIGLGVGMWSGNQVEMGLRGDLVVARRSSLPVILWAVSYAMTQLLTAVIPSGGAGIGVVMMFLSTGAAVGMNANLLRRYQRVKA